MQELIELCLYVSLYDLSISAAQAHISRLWFWDICGCFEHADGKVLFPLSNIWHGYISFNGKKLPIYIGLKQNEINHVQT